MNGIADCIMSVTIPKIKPKFRCKRCSRLLSVKLPHSLMDMSSYCDNYSDDYEQLMQSGNYELGKNFGQGFKTV